MCDWYLIKSLHLCFRSLLNSIGTYYVALRMRMLIVSYKYYIGYEYANSGTRTAGFTEIYMEVINHFHSAIRNTEQHHLSGHWSSGSAWHFGLICREFYRTNLT